MDISSSGSLSKNDNLAVGVGDSYPSGNLDVMKKIIRDEKKEEKVEKKEKKETKAN